MNVEEFYRVKRLSSIMWHLRPVTSNLAVDAFSKMLPLPLSRHELREAVLH